MSVYLCLSVQIPFSISHSPTLRYLYMFFSKTSDLLSSEPMYCRQWFCTFFSSYLQWASKRQVIPSFYMTSIVKRQKWRKIIVALLYPGSVGGFRSTEAPQGGKSRTTSNRCLYSSWIYHHWRTPSQTLAQHYHKHETIGYVTLNDVYTFKLLYMDWCIVTRVILYSVRVRWLYYMYHHTHREYKSTVYSLLNSHKFAPFQGR